MSMSAREPTTAIRMHNARTLKDLILVLVNQDTLEMADIVQVIDFFIFLLSLFALIEEAFM